MKEKKKVLQGFVLPYGPNLYWSKVPEYDLELMKKWDTDFVRYKLEFKGHDNPEIDFAVRDTESLVKYCEKYGIKIMLYTEKLIPESIAKEYPLIGADGKPYPRGHFSIFNFFNPIVKETAIKSFQRMGDFAAENPHIVEYIQPCNEWIMEVPLIGFSRKDFGLVQNSYPSVPITYDEYALAAWIAFLKKLPNSWQEKIFKENDVDNFDGMEQVKERPQDKEFSPTYLAYNCFMAQAMGELFHSLYKAVKTEHPQLKVISSAYIPTGAVLTHPKLLPHFEPFMEVRLGHNVEYWLESGKGFDYLSVNSYSNASMGGFTEFPYKNDGDLGIQVFFTSMSEVVNVYNLKGLVVSELGCTKSN